MRLFGGNTYTVYDTDGKRHNIPFQFVKDNFRDESVPLSEVLDFYLWTKETS